MERSAVAHAARAAVMAATALAAPEAVPSRWAVAATAVRLGVGRYLPGQGSARIHGYTVSNPDRRALSFLYDEIFVQRTYDVGDLPSEATIVDCGANIGVATLFFKMRYPSATVISYEPEPRSFEFLRWNTRQLVGVELRNEAVSDHDGMISIAAAPTDAGGLVAMTANSSDLAVEVRAVRLADALPPRVHLLKVDIEGGEAKLLSDLVATGALSCVDRLAIECHHHRSDEDVLEAVIDSLRSSGFTFALATREWWPGEVSIQRDPAQYQDVMIYARRVG